LVSAPSRPPVAPPIAMLPNSAAAIGAYDGATPGRASMVTRLAAVAAVAPIAPRRRALKFAAGRSIGLGLASAAEAIAGVPGPAPSVGIIRDEAGSGGAIRAFEPMTTRRVGHMNRRDGRW